MVCGNMLRRVRNCLSYYYYYYYYYYYLIATHPKAFRYVSHSLTCRQHHACLHVVSVHQTAPPPIVIAKIAAYYSIDPEG